MMMYTNIEENLLPQGDRTSSDGREGTIVPGPLSSSSNDGLANSCPAELLVEHASAKNHAEENERAGLPIVLIPPMGKEKRNRPGPAFTKTGGSGPRTRSRSRSGSRSRNSSVVSVSSVKSDAAMAVEKDRKARRELELKVRRCLEKAAIARANSCEDLDDFTDVEIESVEYGSCEEVDAGSNGEVIDLQDIGKDDGKGISKRKREHQRTRSLPDPKRGRPPTPGEYVGLAAKRQLLNEKLEEEEEIKLMKKLRGMSSGELYATLGIDLDMAVDDIKPNPTGDIASNAREAMKEVLITSRASKNLKGTAQKVLKHAAVVASATLEVLRTRAEGSTDVDVDRQFRGMRKELEDARKEANQAREELNKLRLELEELKKESKGERRGGKIFSDSDSSDLPPEINRRETRRGKKKDSPKKKKEEVTTGMVAGKEEAPMEIDSLEDLSETPCEIVVREGDDEARKREILPPKEEWPPAIRPAIQGKVKVLEDIPLEGHTVKVIDPNGKGKGKKKEHASVPNNAPVERKGEAHSFMEQLTPLLDKWFSKKAMSFGLMSKNSKDKKDSVVPFDATRVFVGIRFALRVETQRRAGRRVFKSPANNTFA